MEGRKEGMEGQLRGPVSHLVNEQMDLQAHE